MTYRSVFRPGLFKDQLVLVTGGGSGIGRCVAHEVASLGADVMICGREKEKLDPVVTELRGYGVRADSAVCDIREEQQVKDLVSETVRKFGKISALVNNAGGQFPSALENLSKNGWEAVIRNNLTGTFLVAREALNQWFKAHGGAIVNVLADFRNGMPMLGHTGAARAGVDNFTKTASIEWAKYGVRVNSVAPGIIESSGLKNYAPEFIESVRMNSSKIPLKRLGTESEVAAAIVFLISPASSYITGSLVPIDGGNSLRGHIQPLEDYPPNHAFNGF